MGAEVQGNKLLLLLWRDLQGKKLRTVLRASSLPCPPSFFSSRFFLLRVLTGSLTLTPCNLMFPASWFACRGQRGVVIIQHLNFWCIVGAQIMVAKCEGPEPV